jgi:hypothetical protein
VPGVAPVGAGAGAGAAGPAGAGSGPAGAVGAGGAGSGPVGAGTAGTGAAGAGAAGTGVGAAGGAGAGAARPGPIDGAVTSLVGVDSVVGLGGPGGAVGVLVDSVGGDGGGAATLGSGLGTLVAGGGSGFNPADGTGASGTLRFAGSFSGVPLPVRVFPVVFSLAVNSAGTGVDLTSAGRLSSSGKGSRVSGFTGPPARLTATSAAYVRLIPPRP